MRKSWMIVFAFLAIFCVCNVFGQGELKISEVKVVGNITLTESDIFGKIRSREGQVFDADRAGEDAERIGEIEGVDYSYYSTEVVGEQVILTFVVKEKNLVRSIDFEGNDKFNDKKLASKLDFQKGDYLDLVVARMGQKAISDYYVDKGYAFSEISFDEEAIEKGEVRYLIEEGPRVKIKRVDFEGNSGLTDKQVGKAIKSKPKKFLVFQRWFKAEELEKDVRELTKKYYEYGYLDVKVEVDPGFSDDRKRANIVFYIEEGDQYLLEDIEISGNEQFGNEELMGVVAVEPGSVFNAVRIESNREKILSYYLERGFINANVEVNRRFVGDNRVVAEFLVSEGERFRIGKIDISGNEKTQDKVVRRILDEYDFQPGKWWNADIAQGDGQGTLEKDMRQMIYAESATIRPTGDDEVMRGARVDVIEGQTGSIMLGAGIASDSGLIGQLIFDQRNFDIKDTPESFKELVTGKAFVGAGQRLRISLQPGTELSDYSVQFTEPYLNNKPITFDVLASSYERERENYDENRLRGFLTLEKRYKDKWRRHVRFRGEQVDIDGLDSDAALEIVDEEGTTGLFGVRFGATKDMTDSRFNPSKGKIYMLNYEQVLGDYSFGVISGTHRWYKTVAEDFDENKTILATKLHASTIVGNAPIFEKFYAGGQGSLRGFDYRGISPRGTSPTGGKSDDPIGSDWLFLANAEVTVPFYSDTLSWLFFVDSGTVESGGYRASIGTGIQLMIPQWFGPVPMRLELASPLMKNSEDDTQVFSFSMGRLF